MKDILNRDWALWRRYQSAAGAIETPDQAPDEAPDEAPDAMALAAYLEDTLDDDARARIEAWLAAAPERLDLLIAARAALAEATAPAPGSVVRRAADLRTEAGRVPRFSGLAAELGGFLASAGLIRRFERAAVAVALLLACFVGFEMGRIGYDASSLAMEPMLAYESGLGFGDELTEGIL